MRFLRLDEVATLDHDVVFKESSWNKALAVLFCWGAAAGIAAAAVVQHIWLLWIIFAFMFLIGWVFFGLWRKTRLPSNWLVRIPAGGNSLLIKYRSYANPHLPAEDLVAIELAPAEIESIGIEGVTYLKPTERHGAEKEKTSFLELRVNEEIVSELAAKISDERRREAPPRGIFKSTSKSLHYPVSADGHLIRVEWRGGHTYITPGIRRAVERISQAIGVTMAAGAKSVVDLASATPANADEKILALANQGDLIAAYELARRVYHCSLTEAKHRVDDLLAKHA